MLLSVPNFSEGRSERVVDALEASVASSARVLNCHFDSQHHRCVFTLAGDGDQLTAATVAGARHAIELIDMRGHQGLHPHIGALDVCPMVWVHESDHDAAASAAQAAAEGIAALGIPVFLYGELASDGDRRERAFFRHGGPAELARRMASGELRPDLGPDQPHPSAGATLVTARRPLVAFNAEQVPLARVVEEVRRLAAEHGARPVEAELVGLAPAAALSGYPDDPPIRDFDPDQHVIERLLGEAV